MTNHLGAQTSPYLLQHAENPVDWRPWNDAALQLARDSDKPILLSIGYSACHWCHVMERESFENEKIAARMNELFVCIKVDREERPDLDNIYQIAHQLLTGQGGGWPLTIMLTPKMHTPFFSGTYFPPEPRFGRPGFMQVLADGEKYYRDNHAPLGNYHQAFYKAFAQLGPQPSAAARPQFARVIEQSVRELESDFDPVFGGFGGAPKFPCPTQLELFLRHCEFRDANKAAQNTTMQNAGGEPYPHSARRLKLSLHNMAEGGLFDQLGGGFYRYTVDRHWGIPHFEKMLYDNAQLLALYADAARYFDDDFYRAIAAQTAAWVTREMQQPHGGYASTLDADSQGAEGKYYVWTETDLRALLTAGEYQAIESYYRLAGEPNFEGAWHFNVTAEPDARAAVEQTALHSAKAKLLTARNGRVRPALDDKILTAWNGLMIKGMARAAAALDDDKCIDSARNALDFVRANLWRDDRLLVTSRLGESRLNGYLDDYAFLAEGIVELLQVAWRGQDLHFAVAVCDAMRAHFEDAQDGGFFFTSHDHETLLHRAKTGADNAIPAGNAAAARALFQLGRLLGNTDYLTSAEKTAQLFADALAKKPSTHGALTVALQSGDERNQTVIIRGAMRENDDESRQWQQLCRDNCRPQTMLFAIPADAPGLPETLAARKPRTQTIAYVCRGFECSPPVTSRDELIAAMRADN